MSFKKKYEWALIDFSLIKYATVVDFNYWQEWVLSEIYVIYRFNLHVYYVVANVVCKKAQYIKRNTLVQISCTGCTKIE